jgi:hypothetical protein
LSARAFNAVLANDSVEPCFGCRNFERCRDESLACGPFHNWVDLGDFAPTTARVPTRLEFKACFPRRDARANGDPG